MSLFRGEWWLDDGGSATYADGDVGDQNHESVAFESFLGLDHDQFYRDYKIQIDASTGIPIQELTGAWLEEHGIDMSFDDFDNLDRSEQVDILKANGVDKKYIEKNDLFDLSEAPALQLLDDNGANMQFVLWCDGSCDARDYGLEFAKWIRVKQDNFQVFNLDDDALDRIKSFIESGEALNESDVDSDTDIWSLEDEICIEELSTKWYECVPLTILGKVKTVAALKRVMDPKGVAKWHRQAENPKRKRGMK